MTTIDPNADKDFKPTTINPNGPDPDRIPEAPKDEPKKDPK